MSVEYTAAEHVNQSIEETENALAALYNDPRHVTNARLLARMSQALQLLYMSRHEMSGAAVWIGAVE